MTTTQSFTYTGRDASGRAVKGKVAAASEQAVLGRLRAMGVAPTSVAQSGAGTGLNREIELSFLKKGVGLKDLAVMARQMATMIGAGLPLIRVLGILAEQTANETLAGALGTVRTDVESGTSLSVAMGRHERIFPPLLLSLVRAGETGGFLEQSLESAASTFEKEVKLRGTVKAALAYPVAVLALAVLAVIAMLIFIVPVFQKMFAQLGSDLPAPTAFLVWLSGAMWWLVPIGAVAGVIASVWWRRNRRTDAFRRVYEPLTLRIPVFGGLLRKIAIARFARNFATMLAAGVPLLQALSVVGDVSGNWVIEQALVKVQESVRQGRSFSAPLAAEPVFPSMVTQMIAVGEDSGSLEQMLGKIADFYEDEVQAMTESLTSLIEPLVVSVIGLVVGGMIVALYLPIFTIFTKIH